MSSADSVRLILGVDGGGTSTTAWLAHTPADVVGIGRAGPSNAKAIGLPAARQAVSEAIVSAFSHAGINRKTVDSACLGLAGFDRPEDRNLLDEWNKSEGWSKTIVHANDGDLVVAAGTPDGWGIGVIAGTGSIAVGRDRDGKKTRAGGWGYLIGDEGSAYSVVLAALRMVARRADGRDPLPTGGDRLGERLCEALGVDSPARIVPAIYAPGFDRARIAGLAPVVLATLSEGPEIDTKILSRAGADLAEMVIAVSRSMGWPAGPFPLALAGSFLLGSDVVANRMIDVLIQSGFQPETTRVTNPALGAVILAERSLGDV